VVADDDVSVGGVTLVSCTGVVDEDVSVVVAGAVVVSGAVGEGDALSVADIGAGALVAVDDVSGVLGGDVESVGAELVRDVVVLVTVSVAVVVVS
jgi:hypothetical protein